MDKIDNIKNLFGQIKKENKNDLYEKVADEFKMKKSSVRTGWFVRFEIPEIYNVQDNLIAFMQNYIVNQNSKVEL
ncbi:MAG: hypothetical protein V3V28_09100 [Polaribacter sp.]|uniref:hypothetical protein n=1 Tax=Polaribacter sp. TaxID=1920175 RepID=UPI002307C126|nr:hypothetical protein [Tenacibaculum maritimum]MDB0602313.1 hypothetical protein [Tenacibaculum maritimum]MDB0612449.1 hypothetical protein [Tenacibaculum maritimum]